MGATYFLTRSLEKMKMEMRLQVLTYHLKRVMILLGVTELKAALLMPWPPVSNFQFPSASLPSLPNPYATLANRSFTQSWPVAV